MTDWDGKGRVIPSIGEFSDDPRDVFQFVDNNGLESVVVLMERHTHNHLHVLGWQLVDTAQRWLNCREKLSLLGIHGVLIRSLEVCETEQLLHGIVCTLLSPVMCSDVSLCGFLHMDRAIPALLHAMDRQSCASEALVECLNFLHQNLIHPAVSNVLHGISGLSKISIIMDRFKESVELQSIGKQLILKLLA